MSSGGSKHTETAAALTEAENNIAILEKKAEEIGDLNHFTNKLNTKKRIGVFGLPASGKTTFCNNSFFDYTLLRADGLVEANVEQDIEFDLDSQPVVFNVKYGLKDMQCDRMIKLIKSLDHSIILFENDIDKSMNLIKFIYNINPASLMIVLTKYYDAPYGMLEYVEMQFSRVNYMVTHLYFIDNKKYDWEQLCKIIKTNEPVVQKKLLFFKSFA